ncbi:hypothetical protein VTO73DRAFT_5418 [Trametes versicolor]
MWARARRVLRLVASGAYTRLSSGQALPAPLPRLYPHGCPAYPRTTAVQDTPIPPLSRLKNYTRYSRNPHRPPAAESPARPRRLLCRPRTLPADFSFDSSRACIAFSPATPTEKRRPRVALSLPVV